MNDKKRKRSILGIFLILFGLCLILPGFLLTCQLPEGYQYVLSVGSLSETWQGAVTAIERLDTTADTTTVTARKQDIPLQGIREEIGVTLYAVDSAYTEVCHETLLSGRFITPGDVENKRHVLVIDEDTAYALYTGGDAIGKVLNIDGTDWTIVGMIASKARFGESTACVAYVPITAAAEQQLSMDTLEIRVESSDGTGRAAWVQTTLEQWRSDGSFYDLNQEKYAALMPLRWTMFVISLLCTVSLLKWLFRTAQGQYSVYRTKLQSRYAHELLLWFTSRIILLILLGGITAFLSFLTLKQLTAPALIFTDWIPENPVSITSYITRFWAIHRDCAGAVQYMTREKSIATLSVWLIRWGAIAALGGGFIVCLRPGETRFCNRECSQRRNTLR